MDKLDSLQNEVSEVIAGIVSAVRAAKGAGEGYKPDPRYDFLRFLPKAEIEAFGKEIEVIAREVQTFTYTAYPFQPTRLYKRVLTLLQNKLKVYRLVAGLRPLR